MSGVMKIQYEAGRCSAQKRDRIALCDALARYNSFRGNPAHIFEAVFWDGYVDEILGTRKELTAQ